MLYKYQSRNSKRLLYTKHTKGIDKAMNRYLFCMANQIVRGNRMQWTLNQQISVLRSLKEISVPIVFHGFGDDIFSN